MSNVIDLVCRFLLTDLRSLAKPQGPVLMRVIVNLSAIIFFIFGYSLGCRVLYHYLEPYWGEVLSLLALCILLLTTSLFLFILGWFLKPKNPPSIDLMSIIKKTLSEIPSHEILKKTVSMVSPKTFVTVLALAVAASYFTPSKKKNTEA